MTANPTAQVRVAAVGCGYWGPNVIRNLSEVPDFDLRWVCDADAGHLRPVAARYPSARATTRIDDIFDDARAEVTDGGGVLGKDVRGSWRGVGIHGGSPVATIPKFR